MLSSDSGLGAVAGSGEGWRASSSQQHIMDHIRRDILTGRLKPGDQLPLRDELARQFGATMTTTQRAFGQLTKDGFIVGRRRQGTFVAERPPNLCRIGLVFYDPKPVVLTYRNFLALATAAAEQRFGDYTFTSYYTVGSDSQPNDQKRLLRDITGGRLAGLVWVGIPEFRPPDVVLRNPGIPQVFLFGPTTGKALPYVEVRGFMDAAAAEIRHRGGRRTAVLFLDVAEGEVYAETPAILARNGLETAEKWMLGVGRDARHWRQWTRALMQLLFSGPDRPDSLIVSDDNIVDAVIDGLARQDLLNTVPLAVLANFPATFPLPSSVIRVGYDAVDLLTSALDVLERQRRGEVSDDGTALSAVVRAKPERLLMVPGDATRAAPVSEGVADRVDAY